MTDPNLLNYIKQNLQSGFNENQIRGTLLEAGWTKTDIDTAFGQVQAPPGPPTGYQRFRSCSAGKLFAKTLQDDGADCRHYHCYSGHSLRSLLVLPATALRKQP